MCKGCEDKIKALLGLSGKIDAEMGACRVHAAMTASITRATDCQTKIVAAVQLFPCGADIPPAIILDIAQHYRDAANDWEALLPHQTAEHVQ